MFGGFCRGLFGYGLGGSYPFLMFFMMIAFALVIIAAIYFIFRRPQGHKSEAIDILNRKFANGEISEEEYLKKKEILLKK